MAAEIRRVRRKRRSHSRRGLGTLRDLLRTSAPSQIVLLIAVTALAFILGAIFSRYTSEAYSSWRQRHLLQRANLLLSQIDATASPTVARDSNLDEAMRIAK